MRVIDGDALIKKAYDEAKGMAESYDDFGVLVEWLVDKLPTIESESQWIPCSERLPEDDTEVLVYLFDRRSPYIAWVVDCCWFTEDFEVEKENYPTAWMPLPEPYRGES